MAKYIITAFVLICSFTSLGQVKQTYSQYGGLWNRLSLKYNGGFQLPRTTLSTRDLNVSAPDTGQVYYNPVDSSVYYNTGTGTDWIKLGTGGGTNIYNSNGILTGNRTLSGLNDTYSLLFDSLNSFVVERNNKQRIYMDASSSLLNSPNGNNTIQVYDGYVRLMSTGASNEVFVRADSTYFLKRASYPGNIHSTFFPYSLVDKSYVDSVAGSGTPTLQDVILAGYYVHDTSIYAGQNFMIRWDYAGTGNPVGQLSPNTNSMTFFNIAGSHGINLDFSMLAGIGVKTFKFRNSGQALDTLATLYDVRAGGGGSGTVNTGAQYKAAYYPSAGTTVDDWAGVEFGQTNLNTKITQQATGEVGLEIKKINSATANLLNISSNSGTGDYVTVEANGNSTFYSILASPGAVRTEKFGTSASVGSNTDVAAFGYGVTATGNSATLFGRSATGSTETVGIGWSATASGLGTAIGYSSTASNGGVALGRVANQSGNASFALGTSATASGDFSFCASYTGSTSGYDAIRIGYGGSAGHNNSMVFGYNMASTAAGQFIAGGNFGGFEITNIYFANGVTHATPVSYTINGTGGDGTNIAAGSVNIAGGKSTGNAIPADVNNQTSVPVASGTTVQTLGDRYKIIGKYTTLTEATATAFVRVNVPSGTVAGGEVIVTVEANDATDYQARTLRFIWSAVNKAGTTTINVQTPEESIAVSAGTLTVTITGVDSGSGNVDFKADATSSLTQTTLRANAQVFKNFGTGAITAQ